MHLDEKEAIITELERIISEIAPSATRVQKYGGTLCVAPGCKDEQGICGYFVYAKHVSIEFAFGSRLDDPYKTLEGSGKYRRHIKLTSVADITEKHVAEYIRASAALSVDKDA